MEKFTTWNAWQVAVWMNEDDDVYRESVLTIRTSKSLKSATDHMMQFLPPQTPLGHKITRTTVHKTLAGMKARLKHFTPNPFRITR